MTTSSENLYSVKIASLDVIPGSRQVARPE